MKKFLSALPIVILFLSLIVPAAVFRQWWLMIVFLVFGICFGVVEVVALKVSGKTVSQHFWALKDKNKSAAYTIVGFMILAWSMLILHFLWH